MLCTNKKQKKMASDYNDDDDGKKKCIIQFAKHRALIINERVRVKCQFAIVFNIVDHITLLYSLH